MKIFTAPIIKAMPTIGSNTDPETGESLKPLDQTPIILKLFQSSYTAYITEATVYMEDGRELSLAEAAKLPGVDLDKMQGGIEDIHMWGYVVFMENELGTVAWSELKDARFPPFRLPIERDMDFRGMLGQIMMQFP